MARFSKEYEDLKNIRNNNVAALHDATAIYYVRDKRKKRIVEFENVNCWFVNNTISYSQYGPSQEERRDYQPEAIKVDDLLNILWLSNPNINVGVSDNELADIGITALISVTLSENLPKASIIKELDDNIRKYADERLTDKDVIRVATRITKRQLKNIEELNELAKKDSKEFIAKLLKESDKQKTQEEERFKRLEELFKKLDDQNKKLETTKESYHESKKRADEKASQFDEEVKLRENKINELKGEVERQKKERLKTENKRREGEKKVFIAKAISAWRNKSWKEFGVCVIVFTALATWTLYSSNWSIAIVLKNAKDIKTPILLLTLGTIINTIFFGIVVKTLVDKYRNHSNIKAFRESIEIPKELVELRELD